MNVPKILRMVFILLAVPLSGVATSKDEYPARTVTFVVPFPPGGGVDPVARTLSMKLAEKWGQAVVVLNRPGASGLIGSELVRRADPNGYTLLVTTNSFLISPHVVKSDSPPPTDITQSFVPIAMLSTTPMVALVPPRLKVGNLQELAAKARSEPGMLFAGTGTGSPMHMAGELFAKEAGVNMTYSPYRGIALAVNDVLGGHLDLIYMGLAGANPHISSGKLVPLATLEKQRSPLLPTVPTAAEQGFNDIEMDAWFGIYGPGNMPGQIVEQINQDVNEVLRQPDVVRQFAEMSQSVQPLSTSEFTEKVKADYLRYGKIINEFKITAE